MRKTIIALVALLFFQVGGLVASPNNRLVITNINKDLVSGYSQGSSYVSAIINGQVVSSIDIYRVTGDQYFFEYKFQGFKTGDNLVQLQLKDDVGAVVEESHQYRVRIEPASDGSAYWPSSPKVDQRQVAEKTVFGGVVSKDQRIAAYADDNLACRSGFAVKDNSLASCKPTTSLKPGQHSAYLVVEDRQGKKVKTSEQVIFRVEWPMVAPTIKKDTYGFIIGFAKNDSVIKVYTNDKLITKFLVQNSPRGTASFRVKLPVLAKPMNYVYTTATDLKGKESAKSNVLQYAVKKSPAKPASTPSTGSPLTGGQTGQAKKVLGEKVDQKKTDAPAEAQEPKATPEKSILDEILEKAKGKATLTPGLANESNEKQNKFSTNLIIFVVFVAGIIGWILWVNRELNKEKEQAAEMEKQKCEPEKDDTPQQSS